MGEIHELFVLALSLVWFAGATPELNALFQARKKEQKTQAFEPRYFLVGWGSSASRGGDQKVQYVPRNQGDQAFLAGYPGILLGYPGGPRKV